MPAVACVVKYFLARSRKSMQISTIEASSGVRSGLQTATASDPWRGAGKYPSPPRYGSARTSRRIVEMVEIDASNSTGAVIWDILQRDNQELLKAREKAVSACHTLKRLFEGIRTDRPEWAAAPIGTL